MKMKWNEITLKITSNALRFTNLSLRTFHHPHVRVFAISNTPVAAGEEKLTYHPNAVRLSNSDCIRILSRLLTSLSTHAISCRNWRHVTCSTVSGRSDPTIWGHVVGVSSVILIVTLILEKLAFASQLALKYAISNIFSKKTTRQRIQRIHAELTGRFEVTRSAVWRIDARRDDVTSSVTSLMTCLLYTSPSPRD